MVADDLNYSATCTIEENSEKTDFLYLILSIIYIILTVEK